MADIDYAAEAQDVQEQLAEHDIEIEQEELEERFQTLVAEYRVPVDEARRSVLRHFSDDDDGVMSSGFSEPSQISVEDIRTPDEWVTVEVQVVQLWDSDSDKVRQSGLVADETGRIKFTSWERSDLDLLEEGVSYRLENVVTDEWQGRMSVNLNSSTEIVELEDEIEAGETTSVTEGAMVDIQERSGLIKRCTEDGCTRVISNGRCAEHGSVDGEFDLRIKAIIDDGLDTQDVIFNKEATEDITGISIEEAKEMAEEALDTTVVAREMSEQLIGRYYSIEGPVAGRYILANDWDVLDNPEMDRVEELLERAEAM